MEGIEESLKPGHSNLKLILRESQQTLLKSQSIFGKQMMTLNI